MIKKINHKEILLLLAAFLFLAAAYTKYYLETGARERVGGDVVIVGTNKQMDLALQAFLSMHVKDRSEVMHVKTQARAAKTEQRAESEPIDIMLKVVDRAYPLYGTLSLKNKVVERTFATYDQGKLRGAAVSASLLEALSLEPGESFRIAGTTFFITGVIAHEPDDRSSDQSIPRVIIGNRSFAALVQQGAWFTNTQQSEVRVTMKPDANLDQWKQSFDAMFEDSPWRAELWTDHVWRPVLEIKMPFLLITSGLCILFAIFSMERRKRESNDAR